MGIVIMCKGDKLFDISNGLVKSYIDNNDSYVYVIKFDMCNVSKIYSILNNGIDISGTSNYQCYVNHVKNYGMEISFICGIKLTVRYGDYIVYDMGMPTLYNSTIFNKTYTLTNVMKLSNEMDDIVYGGYDDIVYGGYMVVIVYLVVISLVYLFSCDKFSVFE